MRIRHPAWAAKELLAIVDEDPEQLGEKSRAATEPVRLACPACGGGLDVDGAHRIVSCKYCHADVQLPDDVWTRLHPRRAVRPILLLIDVPDAVGKTNEVYMTDVHHVIADRRGNVYVTGYARAASKETADLETMGEDGAFWQQAVVCCDARATVRWLQYPGIRELHIALQHGERELFVWSEAGERLSLDVDGGPGRTRPELPVDGVNAIYADSDGTYVLVKENDVDRCAATGADLPLFPDVPKGFFRSLFAASDVSIGYLAIATLSPAGDVFTIHRAERAENQLTLTRWRRDGTSSSSTFEGEEYGLHLSGLGVSPDGKTVWHLPHRGGRLHRMTLADDGSLAIAVFSIAPADEDGKMVVLPTGEVMIFCEDGVAVRLSADGHVVWSSEAALRRTTTRELDAASRDDDVY